MSQPERNDPCPCGSGKKFKKCCLNNPSVRQASAVQPASAIQDLLRMSEQHINSGNAAQAELLLREVLVAKPNHPQACFLLGMAQANQGKLDEAANSYEVAIRNKKNYYQAMGNLSIVLHDSRKFAEAEMWCRRALSVVPNEPLLLNSLGNVLRSLGKLDAAVASYRRVLETKPGFFMAHSNLGNALRDLGKLNAAVASYRRALEIEPDSAVVHNNMGIALTDIRQLNSAVESFHRALQIDPHYAEAYNSLGVALQELGQLVDAAASFRRALGAKPDFAEAHSNLGNTLKYLGQFDDAVASHHMALKIKPNYAEAHNNLGNVLKDQGQFDDATAGFRRALEIKPDYVAAFNNLLFTLNYHPDKSGEEIYAAYREYDERFGLPQRGKWRAHGNSRETGRRLKVGYVSPDFRRHSCRHFLEPLLAHHDKNAVEVYAYAELAREDEVTARYKGYVDHWTPMAGMTDDALSDRIRADGIDILVDLAGHTAKNRLSVFAQKPAPVSLSWLGFGYTTGLSAVDYLLTDAVAAPAGSEGLFSEAPWRLDTPGYVYRPAEDMGAVSILPALTRGYVTFGALTRAVRINPHTIRVWSEILNRVENARLVIDSGDFKSTTMQDALAEKFAAYGVRRERLEIACHSPPWDVLRGLDIGLDCFPHNSGTTLFETLYMGVPFVTLAGRPSVGRLGSAILEGAGHPALIARTEDDYVALAVALASDLPKLATFRAGLRREMESGALMDETGFARRVETAYREMFGKWAKG
ncbi:MAG: tetratricopeptide repeat protein [Sulfuricellaceae bacterium]